jgi:phenylalanyl-tRNA synthetase beta chain
MLFSEAWLRESVNPRITTQALVEQLTMAGLEVDSAVPAAPFFEGVVVGAVQEIEPHPQASRLQVCRVATGEAESVQIVCGAGNVVPGMRAPVALIGAVLPNGVGIQPTELRGVLSSGMLCSARDLGLESPVDGLMALPNDAPLGMDVRRYLQLDDCILDLDLTPNRADCLSIRGIAREVAVLNKLDWTPPSVGSAAIHHQHVMRVQVAATAACPRYLGRLIRGIDQTAETPLWLRERLRRSGIRSLGPVVDVTSYVLLELGQPLHAFDAQKITGDVRVRLATSGETIVLLNDQAVTLDDDVLVIADDANVLAMAGVMGGKDSAVSEATQDIFLECAFFTPAALMGRARRYGLNTDSSHRFERGVDPHLQASAIERATELLTAIAGGRTGPVTEVSSPADLPDQRPIVLRKTRLRKVLGMVLEENFIVDTLSRLGMHVVRHAEGWQVTPPAFRFDVEIEADLIEELARIHGYQDLPRRDPVLRPKLQAASEAILDIERVSDLLSDRGYQEAITYSFVEPSLQARIEPRAEAIALRNPISSDMAVMRTNLWCGLIQAALRNQNRQHTRIRLFETGLTFARRDHAIVQEKYIAGLATGSVHEEQWGMSRRDVDFFDVKADVEAILALRGDQSRGTFVRTNHPALHPGQAADILISSGQRIGILGMLHPRLEEELEFEARVYLFALNEILLQKRTIPAFRNLSKFPQIRRDIALVVPVDLPIGDVIKGIHERCNSIVRRITVFDVYQGENIEAGQRSVGLALIFQDDARTLTDEIIDTHIADIVRDLATTFNIRLRE